MKVDNSVQISKFRFNYFPQEFVISQRGHVVNQIEGVRTDTRAVMFDVRTVDLQKFTLVQNIKNQTWTYRIRK